MSQTRPQNPLYERYASREMAAVFSAENRYGRWRDMWIALAESQRELGLPITAEQIAALKEAAPRLDLERVAEIERRTRHDVVAHLRHFAEEAGDAGGILHLGATSAFVTDNAELVLIRAALELIERRLAATVRELARFARETRAIPTLAFTHFQPAQLTTVGKRTCLWTQDFLEDMRETRRRIDSLRCRGVKGTTGTQASYLSLFEGDHAKVRELDRRVSEGLGFRAPFPVTGQTYPRKQDSQVLATLAGVAESCHKMGTDLRLLQGLGELSEPFDENQVGSSAMAYKRNPIRAERMCSLARRLMTDSLNGPLTAALQWLERSLDDSANRRLVMTEAFLTADAILVLAAGIGARLTVRDAAVARHTARELPFMATENLLMGATVEGGDRQELHERIRRHSMEAWAAVERGEPNPLLERLRSDPAIGAAARDLGDDLDPAAFTGRSAAQVDEFLENEVEPALAGVETIAVEEPRI